MQAEKSFKSVTESQCFGGKVREGVFPGQMKRGTVIRLIFIYIPWDTPSWQSHSLEICFQWSALLLEPDHVSALMVLIHVVE